MTDESGIVFSQNYERVQSTRNRENRSNLITEIQDTKMADHQSIVIVAGKPVPVELTDNGIDRES